MRRRWGRMTRRQFLTNDKIAPMLLQRIPRSPPHPHSIRFPSHLHLFRSCMQLIELTFQRLPLLFQFLCLPKPAIDLTFDPPSHRIITGDLEELQLLVDLVFQSGDLPLESRETLLHLYDFLLHQSYLAFHGRRPLLRAEEFLQEGLDEAGRGF